MEQQNFSGFSPTLFIKNVGAAITFYEKAFDAKELRRWSNADNSVHVAEMSIGDAVFHLHEEAPKNNEHSPEGLGGTSVTIGLFTGDPDKMVENAVRQGAVLSSPIQDYDYGYRQASLSDPFGHHWIIEKKI